MKKGLIFLFIFLVILLSVTETKTAEITGDTITGKDVQTVAINITVSGPPTLTITNPKNHTYITNISLPLTFDVVGEEDIWYNLDGGSSANITITNSISFNTSIGSHTLYLFANNSNGETAKNVTFFINLTRFIIIYDEFNGSLKGETPDLYNFSYEDLQNMTDLILENAENGKIKYNENINITDDEDITDNQLDLDSHANISFNRIEINSTAIPNFNKTATLSLYNLTFSDPRILRDGVVCPSSICTKESFSGGTLKFNVTGFDGIYSAEETPVLPSTSSGDGGGGGSIKAVRDFSIDREKIKITLKQGETKQQIIIIKNTGNKRIEIELENQFQDFIKISEEFFELQEGRSKIIFLDFTAREDTIPDLYTGKIIIKGRGTEKEILIAIEVESKKPLFDVELEIPEKYLNVLPGENVAANIFLFNLLNIGKVEVNIDYIIKDEEGNEIVKESEVREIGEELSYTKILKIPEDAKSGIYLYYVKVTYKGQVASASEWFTVSKILLAPLEKENVFLKIIAIVVILIIILSAILAILIKLKLIKLKRFKNILKLNKKE